MTTTTKTQNEITTSDATSSQRSLLDSSVFATEISPAAQVLEMTNLSAYGFSQSSEDPETGLTIRSGLENFQSILSAKAEEISQNREDRKSRAANYGLIQATDPSTGSVSMEWSDWSTATSGAGATDEATLANKTNSQFENNSIAYDSSNVDNTLLASGETEEVLSTEEYYYGENVDA